MKVVLFCGGLGMRLRDQMPNTPKPLAKIGYRPIIWHLMNYYAHYGHKDFILCLGYRADAIKEYFVRYDDTVSNDFVLGRGGEKTDIQGPNISDWTIRFVDTGLHANIGMRLQSVREYVKDDEMFLANYSDALTDLDLDHYIDAFRKRSQVASFVSVQPNSPFHVVEADEAGNVEAIRSIADSNIRINGGFFAFRPEIFDYIEPGEELVVEPFERLAKARQLSAYRYDGFWQCMDTFKDKQVLEDMAEHGSAPWQVWRDS